MRTVPFSLLVAVNGIFEPAVSGELYSTAKKTNGITFCEVLFESLGRDGLLVQIASNDVDWHISLQLGEAGWEGRARFHEFKVSRPKGIVTFFLGPPKRWEPQAMLEGASVYAL